MVRALEVSLEAKRILDNGGLLTDRGTFMLEALDSKLRSEGLNPGSVADLTAAVLFIALATGFKP
ncbi:MAG: triphosphoribosyl-dephospho-CoA synthase [Candidatus Freyarchaeota archaeon]